MDVIAAPLRSRMGSSAANPTAVTTNPTPSAILASRGRFAPFSAASRTRLVPKAMLATMRILVTPVAATKSGPNTIRRISGANTTNGTTTAAVDMVVRNTYSWAFALRSPDVSALATAGNVASATEYPIKPDSEVIVTATTYSPRLAGAKTIEITS